MNISRSINSYLRRIFNYKPKDLCLICYIQLKTKDVHRILLEKLKSLLIFDYFFFCIWMSVYRFDKINVVNEDDIPLIKIPATLALNINYRKAQVQWNGPEKPYTFP